MYRVKTSYRRGTAHPVVEVGPWHESRKDAEYWSELLRAAGYNVSIESQNVRTDNDNSDFAAALASMA